jgi:hypothetical protein
MTSLNQQVDNLYTELMTVCESYPLPAHAKQWYTKQLESCKDLEDKLSTIQSMINDTYGMRD